MEELKCQDFVSLRKLRAYPKNILKKVIEKAGLKETEGYAHGEDGCVFVCSSCFAKSLEGGLWHACNGQLILSVIEKPLKT